MAIQHRRGAYNRFNPTRLLPGEWAIVLSGDDSASDGRAAYICFAAGEVKRVSTFEDMIAYLENMRADLFTAADEAQDAADEAEDAAERAEAAIEAIGDITELAVPLMSANTRGGAKLGSGLEVDSDGALNTLPIDAISIVGVTWNDLKSRTTWNWLAGRS